MLLQHQAEEFIEKATHLISRFSPIWIHCLKANAILTFDWKSQVGRSHGSERSRVPHMSMTAVDRLNAVPWLRVFVDGVVIVGELEN